MEIAARGLWTFDTRDWDRRALFAGLFGRDRGTLAALLAGRRGARHREGRSLPLAGPCHLCRDNGGCTPRGGGPRLQPTSPGEQKYMARFRAVSIERVRRDLSNVEIVNIPGTHVDFPFTSREQVVAAMRRFLSGAEKSL